MKKGKKSFIRFLDTQIKQMENDETVVELNENKMYYEDELCRHTDVIYLMKIKFSFFTEGKM